MKYRILVLATLCATTHMHAFAQESKDASKVEEIIVLGRAISTQSASVDVANEMLVDTAKALQHLPGSNVNSNGRLSGIAQYRGMYGDRVSVSVDGLGMISGGPNAMDTPLTYVSPMITEELVLERGIPGVASAPESVGGHIDAKLNRGVFANDSRFLLAGTIGTRYTNNGRSQTSATRITAANNEHKFSFITEIDRGNDITTPVAKIVPSGLSRNRSDLSYAYAGKSTEFMVYGGALLTKDTGTPALAMDIRLIDTNIFGARLLTLLSPRADLEVKAAHNEVTHLMDNFSLRTSPDSMMRYRQNSTSGSGTVFDVATTINFGDNNLKIGVDGKLADHESVISNPRDEMFRIDNFIDVQRDIVGLFSVWQQDTGESSWDLGVRFNQVRTAAGDVSATGMMGMMADAAAALAAAFNSDDRKLRYGNLNAVAKFRRDLSNTVELRVELGSKTRAPSYQELYLWLPLQATGGLADGKNYVGNLSLSSERSQEFNIGLGWVVDRVQLSPQIFIKRVDDYIQGVPSMNMTANMLSTMMSGSPALEFTNVDAKIYGADIAWKVQLREKLFIDGVASYVRGKRTDVSDNLYRLAPLNASFVLNYVTEPVSLKAEVVAYAKQTRVSAYNNEQPSSGYGVMNASISWNPTKSIRLEAQISNILDRAYQNHLAGINRASGTDIEVGTSLYDPARTFGAGIVISF